MLEINDCYTIMPVLSFIIPLPLPPKPVKHIAVAFDCCRNGIERFNNRRYLVFCEPWIKRCYFFAEFILKEHSRIAASFFLCFLRSNGSPADFHSMINHRKLC